MIGDIPKTISKSVSGKSELPDERFDNAEEVRGLCQQMISADNRRAWMRERVDALVSGFPTYPKSVTASKGFGWFPRVNYREAEGLIQAQQTPLFDLVNEVDHCIEIQLDIEADSTEQLQDWEDSIEKNWTWLLFKRWRKSFNYHIPLSQREMLVHGMGAHVWPNKRWIPRTPRSGQILFPEACSLDFEQEGKYFMLRDFVPGEDVYGFIKNESAARKMGWEVDNVWETLSQADRQNKRVNNNWRVEELQRRTRRGDIGYWSTSQVGLWFNWVFVAEYEGGISLYGIEETITSGSNKKKDKGYLFKKRFMFDEWPLVLFPYDVGNGDMHSVRGLGWRTKDFFELSNRVNNAMVAQVLISAFPQMKQLQPNLDPEKMKLMRMGALNILPYGLDTSMTAFPPLNNSGLALQDHLRQTLNNNNQSFTGNAPEPKDRETKYSFMLRSQDAAKVSNGMQSLYESNYQQWQEKMYRLAINTPKGDAPYQKMVQEFRERCLKDGVPEEALKEKAIGQISPVTSSGAGSAALRLQAIMTLLETIYPVTTEDRKITIERDLVGTLMGKDKVDRYARSAYDNDLPDEDESLAMQESNGLCNGGEAIIGSRQNDIKHAENHLAKAMGEIQKLEAGQSDPAYTLDAITRLLQHAGEHLAKVQNVPQRAAEFKELADRWKEIAKYAEQLKRQVESGAPASPQQQLSEQGQLDMAKLQMDEQIKNKKADADIARKFRKDAFQERLAATKTATDLVRTGVKFRQEVEQKEEAAQVNRATQKKNGSAETE